MEWRAAFQPARSFWGTLSDEQFLAWEAAGQSRRRAALKSARAIPNPKPEDRRRAKKETSNIQHPTSNT